MVKAHSARVIEQLWRAFRFGSTGVVVCAVDLALVWVLSHFLWPAIAVSTAYLTAVCLHFCLNKWWVFKNHEANYGSQTLRYGLTVLACWLCTLLVFSAALRLLTSGIMIAKLIAIPPTTLLSYLLMKNFVFGFSPLVNIQSHEQVWAEVSGQCTSCTRSSEREMEKTSDAPLQKTCSVPAGSAGAD